MALEGSARLAKAARCCAARSPPHPNCTVPFTAPRSQRQCGKYKQNPREGEEDGKQHQKSQLPAPKLAPGPQCPKQRAELGFRLCWE